MQNAAFQFEDYLIEENVGDVAGGSLFRAFREAENAGLGRRDLIYRCARSLAQDINSVDRVREQLKRSTGIGHANLLGAIRSSYAQNELCLVSEWFPSVRLSDLESRMSEAGERWPVPVALHLACEIAKALSHLHLQTGEGRGEGLVHGYIRPESIFIGYDGQVKLLSLGMAAAELAALQGRQLHVEGRANYASPEQAAGREADGRSDLFSLGVVLWGLLAGRSLFAAGPREEWVRILNEKTAPPPSQANPDAPAELDSIAAKLLDRDLYLRYESGERALQDLSAVLKFRFPDFTPADFASFCAKQTATFRESYRAFLAKRDENGQETKALDTSAAAETPAPAEPASSFASAKPSQITVERSPVRPQLKPIEVPRPTLIEEPAGLASMLEERWLKPVLIACGVALLVLPFAGPRVLKRVRTQRALAQRARLEANAPRGTLHLLTAEQDYTLLIDGKPVEVVDGAVVVPANRELQVTAKKKGYEDFETETALMADEDLDLKLEFHKSADTGEETEAAKPAEGKKAKAAED